jgi:tetratricopeptide (TPR) repeat protein
MKHLQPTALFSLLVLLSFILAPAQRQSTSAPVVKAALTVNTEPNAIVWIDEVRRGTTDSSGKLTITPMKAGRHSLRVRAKGFKEVSRPLLPGPSVTVKLLPTSDEAELLFQQAEEARETGNKEKAVDLYRQALKLRAAYPAARVGLARVLSSLDKHQEALAEIDAARRTRPIYPEASAVEGRIYKESAFTDDAIKSFRRAIREGNGFQPEAHVGLALILEDKAQYSEAIAEFQKGIDQLSDSEPVIYQMLGAAYERVQKYKEAVAAYEKYLELAPNGSQASAIRSILTQLKREAEGQEIIP